MTFSETNGVHNFHFVWFVYILSTEVGWNCIVAADSTKITEQMLLGIRKTNVIFSFIKGATCYVKLQLRWRNNMWMMFGQLNLPIFFLLKITTLKRGKQGYHQVQGFSLQCFKQFSLLYIYVISKTSFPIIYYHESRFPIFQIEFKFHLFKLTCIAREISLNDVS